MNGLETPQKVPMRELIYQEIDRCDDILKKASELAHDLHSKLKGDLKNEVSGTSVEQGPGFMNILRARTVSLSNSAKALLDILESINKGL